jgi:TPP-dependent indolepyruvate ferredoxin oxidoreductase alpha subunit
MKIERFEDLEIWQEARELCKFIFEITEKEPLWIILQRDLNVVGTRNSFNSSVSPKDLVERPDLKAIGPLTTNILIKIF